MKKKILIVEDEHHVSNLIKITIEDNFEIKQAYDGEQALKMIPEFKPDLIILDIMMPKMNGYEVCNKLKSDSETSDITILMLTAKSQSQDVQDGLSLGADFYFTKPFDPIDLLENIKNILD